MNEEKIDSPKETEGIKQYSPQESFEELGKTFPDSIIGFRSVAIFAKMVWDSAQKTETKPEQSWISVTDRMPDVGVDVLVWVTEDLMCCDIGRRCDDGIDGWDTNSDLAKYRKITHWMPSPSPPLTDR